MRGLLKNSFFTALIVIVATVASVTIATTLSLVIGTPSSALGAPPPPFVAIVFGLLIAIAVAMLTGMFFCLLTLFIAALTMPPVLWLSRWLKLPRPAVDVVGGVLAAWLCVAAGMEQVDSLRQYGMTLSEPIFTGIGVLMGGLAGYLRYRLLVRRLNTAPGMPCPRFPQTT